MKNNKTNLILKNKILQLEYVGPVGKGILQMCTFNISILATFLKTKTTCMHWIVYIVCRQIKWQMGIFIHFIVSLHIQKKVENEMCQKI